MSQKPSTKKWDALPKFDELPAFKSYKGCAWTVWGEDDQLGTINLLTDEVVQRAASEEIKTGKCVSLNWPIQYPANPMFGRKHADVHMMQKEGTQKMVRDEELHINTQSGSQWDGLRHFACLTEGVFYNNTPVDSLPAGRVAIEDPLNIDPALLKIGIQNWADHGICSRGVLLDLVQYYTADGGTLPYDPWSTHGITVPELEAVAKKQGVTFRQGDILLLRVGFTRKYYQVSTEARSALGDRKETLAGIEQSDDMKRFLWDNHFAAVASDQPALERWPAPGPGQFMHETLLGLWGMPIGEMFDLEKLSEVCAQTGRYTFFFSSWPLNILGGCASPPNAAAYF